MSDPMQSIHVMVMENDMTSAVSDVLTLRQLSAGDAEPVLVADFEPFATAPRLSELLSRSVEGRPLYQIDPVGALSQDRLYCSLSRLAAEYVEAFLSSGPAPGRISVVSHCSAAALSMHITKLLLAKSRKVTTILLQPTWPDEAQIRDLFAEFQANLDGARRPCPNLDGEPVSSVAAMEEILREAMTAAAARRGVEESADVLSDLLLWYRAWLAFLLACRNDVPAGLTPEAAVRVLTNAPAGVTVPALTPDAYKLKHVHIPDQVDSATAELAALALAEITFG
jgi:hypothetical protein